MRGENLAVHSQVIALEVLNVGLVNMDVLDTSK